jgi:cobalt-precorrin 5A hydrolase
MESRLSGGTVERGAVIVAGFGFRRGAGEDALRDALMRASGGRPVGALATVADKAGALGVLALKLGVTVIAVSEAEIAGAVTLTRSAASQRARGVGSVAEASALVGAGRGAALLGARAVSGDGMATCALAVGDGR